MKIIECSLSPKVKESGVVFKFIYKMQLERFLLNLLILQEYGASLPQIVLNNIPQFL